MFLKLHSKSGAMLAEILAALLIAAMALFMLAASLSVFSLHKSRTVKESTPTHGVVTVSFALEDFSYSTDVDVVYNEDGYSYAQN